MPPLASIEMFCLDCKFLNYVGVTNDEKKQYYSREFFACSHVFLSR
jgi:hypothetical protein